MGRLPDVVPPLVPPLEPLLELMRYTTTSKPITNAPIIPPMIIGKGSLLRGAFTFLGGGVLLVLGGRWPLDGGRPGGLFLGGWLM